MPASYNERIYEVMANIRRQAEATTGTVTLLSVPTYITGLYHVHVGGVSPDLPDLTLSVAYVDPDVGTQTVTQTVSPTEGWQGGTKTADLAISCQGNTAIVVSGSAATTATVYWFADVARIPD